MGDGGGRPRLGLIVNPIAGLGGTVALKGTDGPGVAAEALRRGAVARSVPRTAEFLRRLKASGPGPEVLCLGGTPAEEVVRQSGLPCVAIRAAEATAGGPVETRHAAARLRDEGAELLAFSGGDGTARDIAAAIGDALPCLGIPCGVKMYSGIFARNPQSAARIAVDWLADWERRTAIAEVVDLDEEALRAGRAAARLYDRLRVPVTGHPLQEAKQPVTADEAVLDELAREVAARIDGFPGVVILGPGGTMAAIALRLGIAKTLLGVDVIREGRIVAPDATEAELLGWLSETPGRIFLTPLGGQGLLLGRGNQQVSPAVIRAAGLQALTVVATAEKLASVPGHKLYVDSGDPALDASIGGPRRIVTGWRREMVVEITT